MAFEYANGVVLPEQIVSELSDAIDHLDHVHVASEAAINIVMEKISGA